MNKLAYDREKSNLGGINELAFVFEASLSEPIVIIKDQATSFTITADFERPNLVPESTSFIETKKNLNLFEYKFTAKIAKDDYAKLQDCILFDANRIIAIVKDNNGQKRLLGQFGQACELTINFDKGTRVTDLNYYLIEINWASKQRAAVVGDVYEIPNIYQFEDNELYEFE